MYIALVTLLMLILPLGSIAAEALQSHAGITLDLIAKWFCFWAVGIRLLLAGARQIAQPRFTAQVILGLKSDESLLLVRELGFANFAIGLIGVGTLPLPEWRLAAAVAGGAFYALAGINHVLRAHRNRLENLAMWSDLFAATVLLTVCAHAVWLRLAPAA
jgi:hypothetical protein